jgi:very-short-patch-repair endonuclease
VLEAALFRALADGALPAPARQFRLPGRGALDGLVDAAYADVRLILEADGRRWHTRIRELRRDHQRDAEAARAGWQTLRLLYEDVVGHPDEVAATVRDVRAVRSAQLAGRTA